MSPAVKTGVVFTLSVCLFVVITEVSSLEDNTGGEADGFKVSERHWNWTSRYLGTAGHGSPNWCVEAKR